MPDLADNDLLELRILTYAGNQIGLNIRHWRVGVTVAPGCTLAEAATEIDATLAVSYPPCMSVNAVYRGVGLKRLDPNPTTETQVVLSETPGTTAGDLMARQVTGIITLRSGLPGRANRGRMYVAFPSELDNDADGHPIPGYTARLDALGVLFEAPLVVIGAAGTATLFPVVKHANSMVNDQEITEAVGRTKWATQRRRGDYGQGNTLPF